MEYLKAGVGTKSNCFEAMQIAKEKWVCIHCRYCSGITELENALRYPKK